MKAHLIRLHKCSLTSDTPTNSQRAPEDPPFTIRTTRRPHWDERHTLSPDERAAVDRYTDTVLCELAFGSSGVPVRTGGIR